MSEEVKPTRRAYRSPRREEGAAETRRRLLDAAARSFVDEGYAATSVTAIARSAGTAPETVYATFGTKARLLEELVRRAARGDPQTPILDQPGPRAVAAERDPHALVARFAPDVAERLERTAPLVHVLESAAASDPKLAALLADLHRGRRENLRVVIGTLAAAGALRGEPEAALDTLWALASPELYHLLASQRGWSRDIYASWLAESLRRLLVP